MENQIIETRTAKFWQRDDGIIHAIDLGTSQITLADAKMKPIDAGELRKLVAELQEVPGSRR